MARRVAALLDRAGPVAIELQRLADMGVWCVTKLDEEYPGRLKQRLPSTQSPPALFGAGPTGLLAKDGIAIIGSRNVDEAGLDFAQQLGMRCGDEGMNAVSGGARGVDRAAMMGALDSGGSAIGVLADSLEKSIRARDVRQFLLEGQLVLLSSALPGDGFAVGRAMERNKYIYCLAEYAIVVATDAGKGGTWAGAVENLRRNWGVPLFVRSEPGSPPGNELLLSPQAKALRSPIPILSVPRRHELADWLLTSVAEQAGVLGPLWDSPTIAASEQRSDSVAEVAHASNDDEPDSLMATGVVPSPADDPVDLFRVFWPRLASELERPRTEAEIYKACDGITMAQLKDVLAQGVENGKIAKRGRPARYSLVGLMTVDDRNSNTAKQLPFQVTD
jgi:predicted Rossmann fold nucleotide-binding protein DprA/Smf involved in DNA uptake